MEDEEEYEFLTEDFERVSRRFRRADIFVLALDLAQGVAEAMSETLTTARTLVAMHANWDCDRETFHEQAALEIEMLTSEGEEDG